MVSDWLPSVRSILADRYRLDAMVGTGASGAVFQAHDVALSRDVALKVIDPALVSGPYADTNVFRLNRILGFRHPGLVRVFDVNSEHEYTFLTEELRSEHRPLSAYIAERGALESWELLELFRQLTASVEYIHRMGTHGNLKPSNVMVSNRQTLLTDAYFLLGTSTQSLFAEPLLGVSTWGLHLKTLFSIYIQITRFSIPKLVRRTFLLTSLYRSGVRIFRRHQLPRVALKLTCPQQRSDRHRLRAITSQN